LNYKALLYKTVDAPVDENSMIGYWHF